jgi:plastocyanin
VRKFKYVAMAALAAISLSSVVMPAQAAKKKSVKKVVDIGDYYFTPEKLTVKSGTTIVWQWPEGGGDGHDVTLRRGPKGVKKFASDVFFADEKYRKTLTVPGTYKIVCTLHEDDMKQTITVKR